MFNYVSKVDIALAGMGSMAVMYLLILRINKTQNHSYDSRAKNA